MRISRSRTTWVAATILVVALMVFVIAPVRQAVLRQAGWVLVYDEPVTTADVIVVTVDSDGAGVLAAADLVKRGVAPRVAIFSDPPDGADTEFLRRGLPYEDEAARSTRQLLSLGVSNIERIARVSGTQEEGEVLPRWCDERAFGRIVVVSTPDHSRRIRRMLSRTMRGHRTVVVVTTTPYSKYDPERWWQSRGGVRTQIEETQKLLLEYLQHPF